MARAGRFPTLLPAQTTASSAPTVDPTLFLVGGDNCSLAGFQPVGEPPGIPKGILAYHADTDAWTWEGEVPAARGTAPTAFWQGRFVISSGEMRPGVRSAEAWSFTLGPKQ